MSSLVNAFYYVVPFIVLLGVLVFVHEFGHFIIARLCGVKVTDFAIGFGKQLCGFTDKHGTNWKICAIPLGGYCQFLGDGDESSTTEVDLSKYSEEEQKHLFATQKPIKKLAIAFAGPFFNYLFAFLVFFGLFFFIGSYDIPPVITGVIENSPAEKDRHGGAGRHRIRLRGKHRGIPGAYAEFRGIPNRNGLFFRRTSSRRDH
jgi:regulator of sigma E protease